MPFYEYECSSCKFYTEVMQKITDAPLEKCPSCGKKALKKLISAPNFRLKGGGWYETDFKGDKEDKRNLAGSDAEEPSKAETASASSESAKAESPKSEPVKTEAPSISTVSKVASKASGGSAGSGSAGAKASSGAKRASAGSGRASKPASRVAASKAKTAPAVRSKVKTAARKKKARR
jgi:putative FmdB family regulatory protein